MTTLGKKLILKLHGFALSKILLTSIIFYTALTLFSAPSFAQENSEIPKEETPTQAAPIEAEQKASEAVDAEAVAPAVTEAPSAIQEAKPNEDLLVEYYPPRNPLLDYRDRRRRGWISYYFGLDYQAILPSTYASMIDGTTYSDLFGRKSIQSYQVTWGPKLNIRWFSLGLEFFYGGGKVNLVTSEDNSLEITQVGARGVLRFDSVFGEPYVVPYFAGSYRKVDVKETVVTGGVTTADTGSVTGIIGTQAGLLIQLDWMDESAAQKFFIEHDVENMFIDIYAQKLFSPRDARFSLATGIDIGGGIGFEF